MNERSPCTYCKGHGWNWQLPIGMNAFAMRMEEITQRSRKITCHCCLGAGTVQAPEQSFGEDR
jgi:RecJ-like exonuclease